MARLTALNPDTATGKVKELFTGIQSKLGTVPNMMRTMGQSAALLEGYLGLSGALGKGTLGAKTGELLALTVGQTNECDYCLAAHTYIGNKLIRIDAGTLEAAKNGQAADAKVQAALQFAQALVHKKGMVDDADIAAVKAVGYTEGEVAEIVGHVGLSILTNYFNHVADTVIDFPAVEATATA